MCGVVVLPCAMTNCPFEKDSFGWYHPPQTATMTFSPSTPRVD